MLRYSLGLPEKALALRRSRSIASQNPPCPLLQLCRGQSSLQQLIGKNPSDFKKQKKGVQARRKAFADTAKRDSAELEAQQPEQKSATSTSDFKPARPSSAELPILQAKGGTGNVKRQKVEPESPQNGRMQCPICRRRIKEGVDINSHVGEATAVHLSLAVTACCKAASSSRQPMKRCLCG